MDCIFCEIINKTRNGYIIYEDQEYIAFLDKYPISHGHTLVLPKRHLARVNDLSKAQFRELYSRVYSLNRHITAKMSASASHIAINDGAAANQLIPHIHVHIIPRNANDNAGFVARKLLRDDEMKEMAKKLAIEKLNVTS